MQSDYLKDFEEASNAATQLHHEDKNSGFTKVQASNELDTDLDEYVTCAPIFKKLRDLASLWVKDSLNEDPYADSLIAHLYRWISSPSGAKLYDPLLHRLVHKLM